MEEANKENRAGRSLLGALNPMKRRPLQALASQGEDESAPLLHQPLTFKFSKPIEVLPKPKASTSKEAETEDKSESKCKDTKQACDDTSEISAEECHIGQPQVQVPPPPRVKTRDFKVFGQTHTLKISKHNLFSVKTEEIPPPIWLLYFHPYLEDSIKANVLLESATPPPDPKGSRGMRMILVDWLAMLQVYLRQSDSVLHLAVRLLDMVLEKEEVCSDALQLTALAAFWIASKTEMQFGVPAWSLCKLCKNSYKVADLNRKEKELIKTVEYKIPFDTPLSVSAYLIMKLGLSDNKELHHMTTFLLDVSLLSWEISWLPHSHLASAATCCALFLLSLLKEQEWDKLSLFDYACQDRDSLRDTIAAQLQLLNSVQGKNPKFSGIREKYISSQYLKIGKQIQEANIELAKVYFTKQA